MSVVSTPTTPFHHQPAAQGGVLEKQLSSWQPEHYGSLYGSNQHHYWSNKFGEIFERPKKEKVHNRKLRPDVQLLFITLIMDIPSDQRSFTVKE